MTAAGRRRLVLVAGEPSGDRHGARLAQAIRAHPALSGFELAGIAGPAMRAAGVVPLARMEDVAVVGFAEILGHLPTLLAARGTIERALGDPATALFVPIDFPGMNLPLCRVARSRGVPVLYYIAPQAWAWGRGRVAALARDVDRLAVILPFEEAFFREAGVAATHVGHPLVESLAPERTRAEFLRALGRPDDDAPFVALLPGSRDQEVARLGPPLLAALAAFRQARPGARGVVAAASAAHARRLAAAVPPGLAGAVDVVDGWTRETLAFARAAVVASGTATLECAALGTPLVIVYRMAALSFQIARRVVRLPRFGLANIVAGEEIAPELLQDAVTPSRIVEALLPLWDDGPARERARSGVAAVRHRLGGPGASERTAALAAELLAARAGGGA
jgi:lipid-A-disaccharide synthase